MSPMIQIYVNLINWGLYTIDMVPAALQADVKAILYPDAIEETTEETTEETAAAN